MDEKESRTLEIVLHCSFCMERSETVIPIPEGWDHRYRVIGEEDDCFCPKHSPIAPFANDQCPGCVGSWDDCSMWRSFEKPDEATITKEDFQLIEKGICPYRTNGTFSFSSEGIEELDMSERASTVSGKAFVQGIREYMKMFSSEGMEKFREEESKKYS